MKRIIAIFAVFALILTIFCGCVKDDFPEEYITVREYYRRWGRSFDSVTFFEKEENNTENFAVANCEALGNLQSMLTYYDWPHRDGGQGLKFVFIDLDNNGIDELLPLIDNGVTAIFTHNGEKAVLLDAYWGRYEVKGIKDNEVLVFAYGGAGGEAYYVFAVNGTEINLTEELALERDFSSDNSEETYYHIVGEEKKTLTKEQFDEKIAFFEQEYKEIYKD